MARQELPVLLIIQDFKTFSTLCRGFGGMKDAPSDTCVVVGVKIAWYAHKMTAVLSVGVLL